MKDIPLDPQNYMKFARADCHSRQLAMAFCVLSKGRKAEKVAEWVNQYLAPQKMPFGWVLQQGRKRLAEYLTPVGLQNQLAHTLIETAKTFGVGCFMVNEEKVRSIHGVGHKLTAMIMQAFTGQRRGILDIHTLRWLGTLGYAAPDQTPNNQQTYEYWEEKLIIELLDKYPNLTLPEADLLVWNQMRKTND